MGSRLASALGASMLLAVACGGGAFSSSEGSGGAASGNGSGGDAAGGKAQGGAGSKAGSSSKGGSGGVSTAGGSSGGRSGAGGVAGTATQGGSGMTVECTAVDQCDSSSKCQLPTCDDGKCGEKAVPDGPFNLQVVGDCQSLQCAAGKEKIVLDLQDADDKNECTADSCDQNGVAKHVARYGEQCSNGGGVCSAQGKCELCNIDTCQDPSECMMPICTGGGCQIVPRPAGTLCNVMPTDADQCDGNGSCVDCYDNGGCGECCSCVQHICI